MTMSISSSLYSQDVFGQKSALLSELQSFGVRLTTDDGAPSRKGGAGPTDHKAITVLGTTIMVPVHTHTAAGWTPTFGPDAMRQFPSVDVGFLAGLGGGSPEGDRSRGLGLIVFWQTPMGSASPGIGEGERCCSNRASL